MSAPITIDGIDYRATFMGSTSTLVSVLEAIIRGPRLARGMGSFLAAALFAYRARSSEPSDAWSSFFAFCDEQPASSVTDYRDLIEEQLDGLR